MDNEELRTHVAGLARAFGHRFVAHDVPDEILRDLEASFTSALASLEGLPTRSRMRPGSSWEAFRDYVPEHGASERRQLFSDSIVSGGANPMGLGAWLWRDGDHALMEVTLGKAFEGAPQRAHGGVVAALIDETMGLVLAINQVMAFTVQLDITYLAPTPINEPLLARAWLERREGRKLFMRAEVTAGDVAIAEASSLFIAVDPAKFHALVEEA